MELQCTNKIKL